MELVNFPVYRHLAVPRILRCDICENFLEGNFPKQRLIEFIDGLSVPVIWQYGEQQSSNTADVTVVWFAKRKGRVPSKTRFIQR